MKRNCEICLAFDKETLHSQKFIVPGEQEPFGYEVVSCRNCGAVFADNIPSQEEYDRYYRNTQKYTYNKIIPAGLIKIHQDMFEQADLVIRKSRHSHDIKILDVGCSIGHLLHIFKQHGYKDLLGVEPARECSAIAKDLYGIQVMTGVPSGLHMPGTFDLVIMTGVLEHISELNNVLSEVKGLLKKDGMVMIAVPDAAHFNKNPRAPYDEFSLEHINYFTGKSLSNLMTRADLEYVSSTSIDGEFYDTKVLVSFYRSVDDAGPLETDNDGVARVRSYISACDTKTKALEDKIDRLVISGERIIVWGTGSLTSRLLATTDLSKANIINYVDSNKSVQGRRINGVEILPPDSIPELRTTVTVFIASYIYGNEIRNMLTEKYGFKGNIVVV